MELDDVGRDLAAGKYCGLEQDSRRVRPGDVFVALRGEHRDGRRFIPEAAARGAALVITDCPHPASVPQLVVPEPRLALAQLARDLHGDPTRHFSLVGVTGTNGKSTVVHLLESIHRSAGFATGLIGTVYQKVGKSRRPPDLTTPGPLELNRLFAEMVREKIGQVSMEVSSHALAQDRVRYLAFDAAVLTNLGRDHLDYHGDLESYHRTKAGFFEILQESPKSHRFAVYNPRELAPALRPKGLPVLTFGLDPECDVFADAMVYSGWHTAFHLHTPRGGTEVRLDRPGEFNVLNALAAAAVAIGQGLDLTVIRMGLEAAGPLAGRCEIVSRRPFTVMVDFAHNPAGLEALLSMAKSQTKGRIILVFGAEGGKDPGKRPLMGEVAGRMADISLVTSDNPHGEDPRQILQEVAVGIQRSGGRYHLEEDRRSAITMAIFEARPGDLVLIAGKGHEKEQVFADRRVPFEDVRVATELLNMRGAGPGLNEQSSL